ncbi:hypothetical protein [Streptomyces bungoensis]|uniref:hypothetical protein n=1 Tax=Streptomyces bungoensis TaxID=285568 RepID=UPI0034394C17
MKAPRTSAEDAQCWWDDPPLTTLPQYLERIRAQPCAHLNEIGAASGADVVGSIAHGHSYRGHVPGPHGRPGGYPVTLVGSDLTLRLPPGTTEAEAVAWNTDRSARDGVSVDHEGKARFTDSALRTLRRHWPDVPASFTPQDIAGLCTRQLRLRDKLRQEPIRPPAE